ncbi:protein phosphatase 1 regulatory subunit 3C-like isoform X1 [Trichogramma pretiosum]|uniref:protein phosphatase 1 regulatory subunit 3C-like isoform X1 n=1 Tax=Trichogramma pretiosum TaxID=7493 RepID=UPI0006C9C4BC|nr:protein phosphatase 1 regulatory subunit 3C-like isoform X1 [Trichogramma pretiosum]XP_014235848.1 protein phosphatase 1 regulatory subunit 3C-like isoform X1 [Trichogramma pretiosum]XP_014235849.1 protein phosphatase 1 regulatory subunit 3C-like isoform X1 [Trichogramma pretiosum]XP_014235850.1 protein phosphatase 1 regulatory subunit 3C-like isoform X1 [Trichogramma pretiosum]XP_014235852.1 protein phosphatase 1 regulatory subunit 3C-like isoform X1 [Trichogramma pretiosum]XP_014235853.1 
MCSIAAIPSELRVLGRSPPVCGSLLYSSLMVTTPAGPIVSRNTVPPQIRSCLASASLQLNELIKTSSEDASSSSVADSNKRNKKRVVFADDRGRPLEHVRVIGESSSTPPSWTSSYVASLVRGGLFQPYDELEQRALQEHQPSDAVDFPRKPSSDASVWELCFLQPASDYIGFRDKLDRHGVSLENVLVNEAEQSLVGTVKVKNLAYVKEVALRLTFDQWTSQRDIACVYVQQHGFGQSSVRSLYDTFRFRVDLSPESAASRQIEFCVRYRTQGQDYWDNNDGANYCLKKKRDISLEEQITEFLSSCCGPTSVHNGFDQTYNREQLPHKIDTKEDAKIRDWSEFASWQHLENDSPYCCS